MCVLKFDSIYAVDSDHLYFADSEVVHDEDCKCMSPEFARDVIKSIRENQPGVSDDDPEIVYYTQFLINTNTKEK